jgi:hypothetical protein
MPDGAGAPLRRRCAPDARASAGASILCARVKGSLDLLARHLLTGCAGLFFFYSASNKLASTP